MKATIIGKRLLHVSRRDRAARRGPDRDDPPARTRRGHRHSRGDRRTTFGVRVRAAGVLGWTREDDSQPPGPRPPAARRPPLPRQRAVGVRPVRPGGAADPGGALRPPAQQRDRKSTRLNSSHVKISYAVFCLKKKKLASTQTHTKPAER